MTNPSENKIIFNEQQLEAINFPYDRPAVVTAAAGSGKTTLLVERVAQLLSGNFSENGSPENEFSGIKADSIAIMTFTRNATKSLREKLNKRLKEMLGECSDNENKRRHISEQILLLRQAYISTIDSFCLRIIRENPEAFDLPLNFSMASLTKKITMQLRAVNLAMKDFYNEEPQSRKFTDSERRALFYTFNFENDNELQESIMDTEKKLSTFIDADGWLDKAAKVYSDPKNYEAYYIEIIKSKFEAYLEKAEACLAKYDKILESSEAVAEKLILEDIAKKEKEKAEANKKTKIKPLEERMSDFRSGTVEPMRKFIEKEKARVRTFAEQFKIFSSNPSLQALTQMLDEFSKKADIGKPESFTKKPQGFPTTPFTNNKNDSQKIADDILSTDFSSDMDPASFANLQTSINAFIKLLNLYRDYYADIKMSSGNLDFSDCELLLLKKLSDNDFREQISSRFKCVIVDEFQDSNDIQAEIFKKIGGDHLFYVGDVKQSIYAFRGGNPMIMADLCDGKDGFKPIPLNKNYRSREAVIATANAAFSGLMTRKYGGVNYAAKENMLDCGATFPATGDPQKYYSEICLVTAAENSEEDMVQPRAVAKRIRELYDDEAFLISRKGKLVRPRFSDFTILMRSTGRMPLYRAALAELGIPTSAPGGRNFLDTEEINLILDYLTIVDNPQRDEEALKVLMSPIYRLNAEEMSQLRLGLLGIDASTLNESDKEAVKNSVRGHSLYSCARICSKDEFILGGDSDEKAKIPRKVNSKLRVFFEDITNFRCFMCTNSIYRLVCKICEDTDLLSTVAAFSDSEQRIANVRQFQDMAAEYESHDGGSLSDFLRYIEYAKSLEDNNIEEAHCPESTDSVKIMTFHSSKGLEFPVCVMCELNKPMSTIDLKGSLLINRDKYLALKNVDPVNRVKSDNLAYTAIKAATRENECGEELRLLYVAMTRAQDKLIMFAQAAPEKWISGELDPDSPGVTLEQGAPFKWVFDSLVRYYDSETKNFKPDIRCTLTTIKAGEKPEAIRAARVYPDISDSEVHRLADKINFTYKYKDDTTRRAKFSVTELAHLNSTCRVNCTKPDFIKNGELTGAEIGTAYHKCMQFIPIDKLKAAAESDFPEIITRAISETNALSADEKRAINPTKILGFLTSEVGRRMLKSPRIQREKRFFEKIDGAEIGYDALGEFALQGVVDMYFIEGNEIVVVDYKTDTIANFEKERENYEKQVKIYGTVLPMQTGLSVKEVYLYTFTDSKEYRIK